MVGAIEYIFRQLTSKKIVAVAGVVYILSQAAIGSLLFPVGHNALRLQLTRSAHNFSNILAQWGDSGVAAYLTHFYLDYIHAVIYAVFLSSAIAFLSSQTGKQATPFSVGLFILF